MQVPINDVPNIMDSTCMSLKNRSNAQAALPTDSVRLRRNSQRIWKFLHRRKNIRRIRTTDTTEMIVISRWAPDALSWLWNARPLKLTSTPNSEATESPSLKIFSIALSDDVRFWLSSERTPLIMTYQMPST